MPSSVQVPGTTSFRDEFIRFVVTPSGVQAPRTTSLDMNRYKNGLALISERLDMISL